MGVDEAGGHHALERRQRHRSGIDERRLRLRLAVQQLQLQQVVQGRLDDVPLCYPDPRAARSRYDHLARVVDRDVGNGATVHERLGWTVRQVPRVVAAIDGVVLFTFCAVVLNVDLSRPLATGVPTLAAVLLAVLASGVAYAWLALTGERIRIFRGELGEVRWRLVGSSTWVMVAGAGLVVLALAVLMYTRVTGEVALAGGLVAPGSVTSVGLVFAALSAVGNLSVVAVHALDGSPQTQQGRRVGRLLRRHEREVHRHRLAVVRTAGRLKGQRGVPLTWEDGGWENGGWSGRVHRAGTHPRRR